MLIKLFSCLVTTQRCKITDVIDKYFHASFSNFFRIFYSQCSGCGISWICQRWKPLLYQLLIILFKIIFIDKDLASYFHLLQPIFRKLSRKRDTFYLFNVRGDLISLYTISTGCTTNQKIVFINKRNTCSVKFWFNTI